MLCYPLHLSGKTVAVEAVLYNLLKIGIPAAVGGFIDFLMSKREQKALREWLAG